MPSNSPDLSRIPGPAARAVPRASRNGQGEPEDPTHPIEPSFRHFAESLSDLVWSARPDGSADYYNRRFLAYLGRTPEELRGWAWFEALHPDDMESGRRAWEQAVATGSTFEAEFRLRRHDGVYRRHRCHGSPLRDDEGRITRWFGTCSDASGRAGAGAAALRASEARLRQLADTMPQVVWTATPDGLVDYFNARWYEYTGLAPEASLGEGWRAAVHPDDLGRFAVVRDRGVDEGRVFEAEVRVRRRDGSYRWHLVRSVPVADEAGALTRRFGAATDIDDRRRAEEALRESERQYRAIYDQAAVGIAEVDLTGRFLRANDRYCEIVGYPCEELVRLRFQDITYPDDPPAHREQFARIAEGPSSYTIEKRYVRKDGRVVWAHTAVSLLRDGAGRPERVMAVVEDITERVRAEQALRESEERFARFMQHLPGLAWIKDVQGRYVYANDAAVQTFRTPRDRLYGRTDEEVFPPGTAARFRENDRRALESGAGVQMIETLVHGDGIVHHSIVSKFPIPGPDGGAVFVGGMAIDVTDRLEMEAALKEADRRKDDFLATLAHELRNPLAPIRTALHLMAQPVEGGHEPDRAMAERHVVHLARLVDDLMDVARIGKGKIELRTQVVDLAEVVAHAVESARWSLEERGHELAVSMPRAPIRLEADPTRLEQVLDNLLSNACKYTDRGGRIALSVERRGGEVEIRVADTGIGIPAEELPQVFEMFAQVEGHSARAEGGLGIGLGLVRTLVEMHGGTIEARSDGPGTGSEFVVRLPTLPDDAPERPQPERRRPGSGAMSLPRRRILVVDDNADAANSLAKLLSRLYGQDVKVAHDGPEALAAAEEFRPEVVLLDIGMPGMDGYEVARRLRERAEFRSTQIVALTGWGQESDRRKSSEAGFDHHLVKPVAPEALRELLSQAAPA